MSKCQNMTLFMGRMEYNTIQYNTIQYILALLQSIVETYVIGNSSGQAETF
jgi:hypothetical protein